MKSEELALLHKIVDEVSALNKKFASLNEDFLSMKGELGSVKGELGSVRRSVNAIETLPVPYGRPKTFVSATEFHSVSDPVRVKLGYQG